MKNGEKGQSYTQEGQNNKKNSFKDIYKGELVGEDSWTAGRGLWKFKKMESSQVG